MVVVIVGGRLVDKFGTRRIVLPGLLFMAIPLWGLVNLTPKTPYGWFQFLLILRGGEIGLVLQPLARSALVMIPQRQLSQASSLSTVVRFVASSLITALIGTMVQTQQKVHYTHLAEQVVPGTPFGQLISIIQARLQASGVDAATANTTAILQVSRLVQQQSYALALQDGYKLTGLMLIPAILAVLFIQTRPATIPKATKDELAEKAAHEPVFLEG
jgi:DHA2 family multidrug resistance protein